MIVKKVIVLVFVFVVVGLVYGLVQYNKGYNYGYLDGANNPTKEMYNQIHNVGFDRGWQSGSGQPSEELLLNDYIVLVNFSQDEVYRAQGINKTSSSVDYKVIIYHFKSPVDGSYNESLGAGWSGPEFIIFRKNEK